MEASIETLRAKLGSWVEEAHALERRSLLELEVAVGALEQERRWPGVEELGGEQLLSIFREHRDETERHERLLRARLEALGRSPSRLKRAKATVAGITVPLAESIGKDKPATFARDAFAVEQMEIATYELLERLAARAGDDETAEVARRNRADEDQTARRIAESWDRVIELTLAPETATSSEQSG